MLAAVLGMGSGLPSMAANAASFKSDRPPEVRVESRQAQKRNRGRGLPSSAYWRDRSKYKAKDLRRLEAERGVGLVTNPNAAAQINRMFHMWFDKKFATA